MNISKNIEYIKRFGENLRRIRLSKNISKEVLAFTADIPISQIGRTERGEINTTIYTVKVLATALNIHVSSLFEFD